MTGISGTYEITANTPMGNQNMTLVVNAEGETFTGSNKGQMGSADIGGSVDGNTIRWKQPITVPMPLTLDCEATIDGDAIAGSVDTGAFGRFAISGRKVG